MDTITEGSSRYQDFYRNIRERINRWQTRGDLIKKRDNWTDHIVQYLFVLPDLFHLMVRLVIDPQTPSRIRAYILVALGYLICPLDVIPDLIPVIGLVDDLVVAVVFLNKVLNTRDETVIEIIRRSWAGEKDIFAQLQEITAVLNELSSHIPKGIYNFIKRRP